MASNEIEEAKYWALRKNARDCVAGEFNSKLAGNGVSSQWSGMTLASITGTALEYANLHWKSGDGILSHHTNANWEKIWYRFSPIPHRFDIAVWQNVGQEMVLQGMAVGRFSNSKSHLTLHFIERNPDPGTYLRGGALLPILASAEWYAKCMGSERVLIKDPLNPVDYDQYQYYVFSLKGVSATYVAKSL